MPNYYCDADLATGSNDGTSWANAWQTFQRAVDGIGGTQPTAGDTVWCKGTDSISSAIDMDGNSGTVAGGHVKFVGVNAATTNEPPQSSDYGEYFVIDGQNNAINGLELSTYGTDFIWLENIKITQCDGTAALNVGAAYADNWVLHNTWFHDNAAMAASVSYMRYTLWYRCRFTSNTGYCINNPSASHKIILCVFSDNSSRALNGGVIDAFGCVFHNNDVGAYCYGGGTLINCVFDGNSSSGVSAPATAQTHCVGCRFTNQSDAGATGFEQVSTQQGFALACYFGNNTTHKDPKVLTIPVDGVDLTVTGGTDTDQGYEDPTTNNDFNLRSDATLRSVAIELD